MIRVRSREKSLMNKLLIGRFVSVAVLLGLAVTCRRHDLTITNEYILSLPKLTDGVALYLPYLLTSHDREDRLYLWALDPLKNEPMLFRGKAQSAYRRTPVWDGLATYFDAKGSVREPEAAQVTIYANGAVVSLSPPMGESHAVNIQLSARGRYVQRPHSLRLGCGRPSLKRTAELLCRGRQPALCGGRVAIGYANDRDPKSDPIRASGCRWVLGDNQSVIVQRDGFDLPSGNRSEELPLQMLDNDYPVRVTPRDCDPESGESAEIKDIFVRFDGTLLWTRRDDRSDWLPCFPDARVVLSPFAPELLDEPPTNANRLLHTEW